MKFPFSVISSRSKSLTSRLEIYPVFLRIFYWFSPLLIIFLPLSEVFADSLEQDSGGWEHHFQSELAYIAVFGNTESQAGKLKVEYQAKLNRNEFLIRGGGSYGISQGKESINNYSCQGKFSYFLFPRIFSFSLVGFESNKFAGFWARTSGRTGAGYKFLASEKQQLSVESGLDYSYEIITDRHQERWLFSGISSLLYEYSPVSSLKFRQRLDWIYLWEYFYDYRLESETALKVQATIHVGFQFGINARYVNLPLTKTVDSQRQKLEKIDTIISTSLVVEL